VAVRLITRAALVRIAIALVVFVLAFEYTCRCGGQRGNVTTSTTISPERLQRHVQVLAGDIGERNVWRPGTRARGGIAATLPGLRHTSDGGFV
jgi:hypothetical protein